MKLCRTHKSIVDARHLLEISGASYSLREIRTKWKLKDYHRIEYPTSISCQLKGDINVICHQCFDMLSGLLKKAFYKIYLGGSDNFML